MGPSRHNHRKSRLMRRVSEKSFFEIFFFEIFLFRRLVPSKPHTGRCNQFLLSRSFKHSLFLDQALDRLVLTSSRITAFTPSTYQPCCLQGVLPAYAVGYLFSRGASRLDAFSVYPVRTSLPCYAVGTTTVAPEVRPFRSSRTRNSSSHVSYAHDG